MKKLIALLIMSGLVISCQRVKSIVARKAANPQPQVSSAPLSPAAQSEILSEMYQVVFLVQPKSSQAFSGYLENLQQGASFEGIYNGFVHSAEYRDLETKNPGSSEKALAFFADELARAEENLPARTKFDASSAKPLASMDMSEDVNVPPEVTFESPRPEPSNLADWKSKYERVFQGASVYTLKRVLGDEAMKVIDVRKSDRKALSDWYAQFSARTAKLGVDFGLSLRNQSDAAFHKQWAMHAPVDLLTWEVLNRIHRVLNAWDGKSAGRSK